ncbi:MAG: OmpA family protein, partial [Acidobacteria bacterium]|nr:OmpA family protein [Acidobacteriota bacterium]
MTFGRKTPQVGLFVLVFTMLFAISCRKSPSAGPTTTPPPPPAPATAPPPAPAPTITLRADRTTIDRGESITLTWSSSNAGTVRIEPGIGEVPTSGNRQASPTSSVTYTATATGPGGNASDVARITVNVPPPPPARPSTTTTSTTPPPRPTATVRDIFTSNEVYFDYDKSDIRPDQVSKLQTLATSIRDNPNVRFTIEGHADERGSQEYNLALGDRRANSVKQYLV